MLTSDVNDNILCNFKVATPSCTSRPTNVAQGIGFLTILHTAEKLVVVVAASAAVCTITSISACVTHWYYCSANAGMKKSLRIILS